jgi:hypothetical protein
MIADGVAHSLGIEDPARTEPLSTLVTAALTGLSLEAFIEGDDKLAGEAHDLFLGLLERGIERFAKRPDSDVPPASELGIDELPPPYDVLERRIS